MGTESNYYKEIINKLESLTKREYALFASLGIQAALLIGITTFAAFAFIEMAAHFSSTIRTVLFFIFSILFISSFTFLFVIPLFKYFNIFRKTNYLNIADKIGQNFPSIKDDLLNAMQLISVDNQRSIYSHKLIDAAFYQVYNRTKSIKFESIINFKKAKELLIYFTGVIVFCALLFLFIPGLQAASHRLVNFDQEFIPPPKFSFEVEPGNYEVTKGDDVFISVKVKGEIPREVYLALKDNDQTDFELQRLMADSLGIYNFDRPAIRNSFRYYAAAQDISSEEFIIEVIDRPIVKTFDVIITPPSYAKMSQINQKDNGNVTALLGSVIEVNLTSTKSLSKAELIFTDTTKTPLTITNNIAEGKFRVKKDNDYQLIIADENGNSNHSPITYSIKALTDAFPSIDVIEPNRNVSLSNDNRLPVYLKAADDFGFTKLLLHYKLSASKYEPPQKDFKSMELPLNKEVKETDVNYVWNLSQLNLATEDVVTYYFEIFDNDNVSGPKSAKSSAFNVRVPSLDEILNRAEDTQNQADQDLKQTLKEADELKKTLEKIDQDLKQDKKELTWEEKEKIENALDKFEQLQEKVDNISEQLKNMQQQLQQNDLLSEETLEKYMELQKLFEDLTGEEMKKAMEQMRNMLQEMNRKMTQDAMQNMKIDEEKFKKSLERTISLLKRIQAEQKVDELLKRTEELTNKQENLKEQTEQNDLLQQDQKEDLSNKQDEVSEELEKMNQEMEELSKIMEELKDMPKEDLDKLMEEFEKQKNQELSKEASEEIQKNQKQSALNKQSQVSQNMQKMKQKIEQLQQSMAQQNQMQAFTDMMKIMDNILTLSKQQEELKNKSNQLDPSSSAFNENAKKQSNLQNNLEKILEQMSELSKKTFAITPEMGKSMGDAKREMQKSIQAMQNRNGSMAAISQGESMKSLNEAASLMKGSMESMMQGGGQGGMMSLMQQLGQMSQQQMDLNNMTQMLQQGMQGNLSPQQQGELQRLAQQQELIRKSIEQLNKEAKETGKSKSIPSNLENVVKQMQEVITDMKTEKLDDQLLQKQERILSKLLDAQRSINERDFEKERESFTGENILHESPADLNLSSDKGKNKIKDELNSAVQEGYTKDYEALIRKYYEALQKENIKN